MINRRSEAEWKQIVADYKASGLSAKKWCENAQLKFNTFKYLLSRINNLNISDTNICFAEMKIPEDTKQHKIYSSATIRYENFAMDISEKTDLVFLAEVIKTLQSIC
jgi:hypothetical protein